MFCCHLDQFFSISADSFLGDTYQIACILDTRDGKSASLAPFCFDLPLTDMY